MLNLDVVRIWFTQRPPTINISPHFVKEDGTPLVLAEAPAFQVLAEVYVTSTAPDDTGKGKYLGFTQIMTKGMTTANYRGQDYRDGSIDLDWSKGPKAVRTPCRDVLTVSSPFVNYPGADDISFPAYKSSTELVVPQPTNDFGIDVPLLKEKWPRKFIARLSP